MGMTAVALASLLLSYKRVSWEQPTMLLRGLCAMVTSSELAAVGKVNRVGCVCPRQVEMPPFMH